MFEIIVPYFEVCGIKLTPVVKVLKPGQVVQIMLEFQSFFKKLKAFTLKDLADKYTRKVK
jgi:hypothetical protein